MKPCLVFIGNKDWYNWYQEEVTEVVNWAQAHKIRVCTRKRKDGFTETGFFTMNPIKQFRLGLVFTKSGVNNNRIDSIKLTPGVTDGQIDKLYGQMSVQNN